MLFEKYWPSYERSIRMLHSNARSGDCGPSAWTPHQTNDKALADGIIFQLGRHICAIKCIHRMDYTKHSLVAPVKAQKKDISPTAWDIDAAGQSDR